MKDDEVWIELPPVSPQAPRRLIVFLHERGSSAEGFAPVGIAWQLKFPGATGVLMHASEHPPRQWFDAQPLEGRAERIARAAAAFGDRLRMLQDAHGLGPERTMLVGFGQGATVALEAMRAQPRAPSIVVAYAGQLATPIRPDERIDAAVHLVHGTHDSLVPLAHATRAHRGLAAAGAHVTLDVLVDGVHSIDQEMIVIGTRRAMQSVFRGRGRMTPAASSSRIH